MRFGSPFTAGFGAPDKMVAYCYGELAADHTSARFRFTPRTGYGGAHFALCVNARGVAHRFVAEGEEASVRVPLRWGAGVTSFLALRVGGCSDPAWDPSLVARTFEAADALRVSLELPFNPEVLGAVKAEDNGVYCSSWSLTGLDCRRNITPLKPTRTRAFLDLDLAVAGGNVTVTLSKGGVAVASGTGAVGGSVTLAEQNGSGLSGSVTVAAGVVSTTGARLYVRWPASVQVLRDAADPPTVAVATIPFNGDSTRRWTERSDLAAGIWYYRLRAVSDTGENGTPSATLSFVVPLTPGPPTGPAYLSGNAAATVLSFVASATAGASYRAYLQQIGAELVDLEAIAATAAAGATQITLPALTGYAGTARVILRAVKDGLEERNLAQLDLEYDAAGVFVPPRPNACGLAAESEAVIAGLTLAVPAIYDSAREKATATHVHLYKRTVGGSYAGTPDASANLAARGNGLKRAALSYTFGAAGWYYVRPRAATAANIESVAAACPEYLVYVSDADPSAPVLAGELSRG
jgi:hypothetical protein